MWILNLKKFFQCLDSFWYDDLMENIFFQIIRGKTSVLIFVPVKKFELYFDLFFSSYRLNLNL